jgi:hypothetical protein
MRKILLIGLLALFAREARADHAVTLYDTTSGNYFQLTAPPTLGASYIVNAPLTQGATNQILQVTGVSSNTITLTFVNPGVSTAVITGAVTISTNGHINAEGTAPSLTFCGTGSPSIVGSDIAMIVTVGSSTGTCNVIFKVPYTNPPSCAISDRAANVTNALTYSVFTSSISLVKTAMGGDIIDIHCTGRD